MFFLQPNASGSCLPTCIDFAEQRLKFSQFEGSIIPQPTYYMKNIKLPILVLLVKQARQERLWDCSEDGIFRKCFENINKQFMNKLILKFF